MKCPHCEETNAQVHHQLAMENCENCGANTFNFRCPHCKKIYSVYFYRVVKNNQPCKTTGLKNSDLFKNLLVRW